MARYSQSNPNSTVLTRLDDPTSAYLPQAYKDAAQNAYNNASSAYGNSFSNHHPIASKALAALAGLVALGPSGALLGPALLNKREDNRKAGIVSGYQNALKALSDNQQSLLPTQQSATNTLTTGTALRNKGILTPIPQGGLTSDATMKNLLDASNSQQNLNNASNMILDQHTSAYQNIMDALNPARGQREQGNAGLPTVPTLPQSTQPTQALPPMFSEGNPIQLGAQKTAQLPAPQPLQPSATDLMPYTYQDPSLTNALVNQLGETTRNAATTLPNLMKYPSEIAQNNANAYANTSLGDLRKKQTVTEGYRPGLIQAETLNNTEGAKLKRRTDPNIRSGSSNNPLAGISQFQGILQNQKQAILSQMQQNGFIDKKTGMITPPTPQEASDGFFGLGAHPANTLRVNQYNALKQQLDKVDSQLTGGLGLPPSNPNPNNPPSIPSVNSANGVLKGKHGTYRTK